VTAGTKSLVLTLDDVVSGTPLAADFTVNADSSPNRVTDASVSSDGQSVTLTVTDYFENNDDVVVFYTANANAALVDVNGNSILSDIDITVNLTNDTVQPTVVSVSSTPVSTTYVSGGVVPIQIQFSEDVVVSGTPTLTLDTGATNSTQTAFYQSGSGENVLTFSYTVQPGDESADLEYVDRAALQFNDGIIEDPAGNILITTLPELGTQLSLGYSDLIVDTSGV